MSQSKGITITTWSGGQEYCEALIKSMWNIEYPVLIVINDSKNMPQDWWYRLYALSGEQEWHIWQNPNDGFEIGAIEATLSLTKWDEFILLQDTIEIKDQKIFDKLFEDYPGQSVSYNPYFQMYLGKYRREVLEKMMPLPQVRTKIDAVREEWDFTKKYSDVDGNTQVFNRHFVDDNFYDKIENGVMKMQDDYIIKYKRTWNALQLG
jgi:hypothetical protein